MPSCRVRVPCLHSTSTGSHGNVQDPEADELFSEGFFSRLVTVMAGSDVTLILNVLEAIYQVRVPHYIPERSSRRAVRCPV